MRERLENNEVHLTRSAGETERPLQVTSVLGVNEGSMARVGEIDQVGARAYELSAESDRALHGGELTKARELMAEAAVLDGRYSVRAQFVGRTDSRRVRVASTMRKLLIAPLTQAGFSCGDGISWKPSEFLDRRVGDVRASLLLGPEKFGGAIGVLACRAVGNRVTYFDWRRSSLRSGRLNYRTQAELEAACSRWHEVLREEVFPWFERRDA